MTESEFERIDDFLAGKLTTTEQQRMVEAMAQDDQLRQAVEQHRAVRESLQVLAAKKRFEAMHLQLDRMGLLAEPEDEEEPEVSLEEDTTPDLEVIRSEPQEPVIRRDVPVVSIRRNYFWQYAAASVFVGVLLGTLFIVQYRGKEGDQSEVTFRQYFRPDSTNNAPQLPSEVTENEKELSKAIDEYRHNRLKQSEEKFKTIKPTSKGTAQYYQAYYIGLIALEHNQTAKAIDQLETARQAPIIELQQRSEWYLGLAYLKAHRSDDARQLFTQIANTPGHAYQQKASNLLQQHY
ncbi:tetratricopeptide repeat protein [Spirosoma panaciterrae]|uniref:tetratricopeptide repeat protein n=1 Tax=Spirosoma panaciterrae TaxID=496058 RepID=UPI00036CE204|nr:hypothetical protein [Spirosoma panaciterrae]